MFTPGAKVARRSSGSSRQCGWLQVMASPHARFVNWLEVVEQNVALIERTWHEYFR